VRVRADYEAEINTWPACGELNGSRKASVQQARTTYVAPSRLWASFGCQIGCPHYWLLHVQKEDKVTWNTVSDVLIQQGRQAQFGAISGAKPHIKCDLLLKVVIIKCEDWDISYMISLFSDSKIACVIQRDPRGGIEPGYSESGITYEEVYAVPLVSELHAVEIEGLLFKACY
jgi:hypothetical protein